MKNLRSVSAIMLVLIALISLTQCRKEVVPPKQDPGVVNPPVVIPAASEINTFVWSAMHDYYLWDEKIPNLTNTYYQMLTNTSTNYNRNKDSLNAYLNKYTDPNKLFNSLIYQSGTVDKWSFIVSDYTTIENWIAGISKTMGYDFMLYRLNSTSDQLVGVVRYVLKGSPAETAGVKRGDLFSQIDGTQLTIPNYQGLIAKESFTLSMAKIVNGAIELTGKTAAMTAVQIQEDPVYLSKTLIVNGEKVGYLVYNGFTSDFDLELNTVMQKFKTDGITKLIVDLRYNGGGSVQTATYLASMIYTTDVSKVFSKSVYNSILQNYFDTQYGVDYSLNKFTAKIAKTTTNPETPITSNNLSQVYFIVSKETASASELLINGLKPYMNVKVFGTNTYGKYVGSFTIKDYDANGVLVTTHKWAMQPITVKIANSLGVSDYVDGLVSDVTAAESITNLLPLGDETETLLKAVLDYIKLNKSATIMPTGPLSKSAAIMGTKDMKPFSFDMYITPVTTKGRQK